jgi:hypothetical protein
MISQWVALVYMMRRYGARPELAMALKAFTGRLPATEARGQTPADIAMLLEAAPVMDREELEEHQRLRSRAHP